MPSGGDQPADEGAPLTAYVIITGLINACGVAWCSSRSEPGLIDYLGVIVFVALTVWACVMLFSRALTA